LTRTNNIFIGYVSTNGTVWIPVGTNTIPMATNYLVGLAVCSRTTSALDVSTFDNVTTAAWSSPAPDIPTGLAATAGDGQAALTWNVSTNAADYNVKRALTNGGPYSVISSGLNVPAFTDTGLVDGTKYYYVVSSSNPVGESANSSPVSVIPVSSVATNVSLTVGNGQLQLSWPADHTGWELQAQTNSRATGLGTNWVALTNSWSTNRISVRISATNGSVFFRLVYP